MNEKRRMLLKGMALGGFAGVGAGISQTVMAATGSASDRQLFVLVNEALSSSAFIDGVAASGKSLKTLVADTGMAFVNAFNKHLSSQKKLHILGLTDDASAVIILDLARSAGASVKWIGHHTLETHQSIHGVSSVDSTRSCTVQLAKNLQQCGQAFMLNETHRHVPSGISLQMPGNRQASTHQWMADLGYSLAVPNGFFSEPALPLKNNSVSPDSGHFVSFSIET